MVMRFSAKVSILTGSPILSTKISPPLANVPACKTRLTASGMVIKYLIMSGWVTVTGPPFLICSLKSGITEPLEPSTLPNLTAANSVLLPDCAIICTISSQQRLVAPMTLVGLTALSVEIMTNFSTPCLSAICATLSVPKMLFLQASSGLVSIKGTCLCAAAWKTILGICSVKSSSILSRSVIEAISTRMG